MYSLYIPYQPGDSDTITNSKFLHRIESLHPAFTFFVPALSCPPELLRDIGNYVQVTRTQQKYRTIPIDLLNDNRSIDRIISADACTAFFDSDGFLWSKAGSACCNLFHNELPSILKNAFPKSDPD